MRWWPTSTAGCWAPRPWPSLWLSADLGDDAAGSPADGRRPVRACSAALAGPQRRLAAHVRGSALGGGTDRTPGEPAARRSRGHRRGWSCCRRPSGAAPLLAFRIAGWDAEQVADELSRSIFAITEADTGADLLRVSVGAWNREDELERFVERVAELAANTPASLPRRPSLTIIHGSLASEDAVTMNDAGPMTASRASRAHAPGRRARCARDRSSRSAGDRPATPRRRWCAPCWPTCVVAVVGGVVLLLVDWLVGPWRAARRRCTASAPVVYVAIVIVSGSVLTWLWVELPTGRAGERRRSGWSAVLGFFASIPIVYLSLVVIYQVLRPAAALSETGPRC